METFTKKPIKRLVEPVDEWLQNEGFYRKHAPKDPTCLFRSVSEQIYKDQRHHLKIRKECVEFMRKNRTFFEEKILTSFDNYLEQMICFTEWGGMNEILAMSLLYKKNVVIFNGQKLVKETVLDHEFEDNILLCFTPPKQYETVYTKEYISEVGFCQSLAYQILYKNVFKMSDVDETVYKMLHNRSGHLRHEKFFLKKNLINRNKLTSELLTKTEDSEVDPLTVGITPFPYRVAKALDPNIYRNIDYDIWHEIKKEVRNSGYTKFNTSQLQVGSKCLVELHSMDDNYIDTSFERATEMRNNNFKNFEESQSLETSSYIGHIQKMSKYEGPIEVFIEGLGKKLTVPYEAVKPFLHRKIKQNNFPTALTKNINNYNIKRKKNWNNVNRKINDQMLDENIDKTKIKDFNPKTNNSFMLEQDTNMKLQTQTVKFSAENNKPQLDCDSNMHLENMRNELENIYECTLKCADEKNNNSKSEITNINDSKEKFDSNFTDTSHHTIEQHSKAEYFWSNNSWSPEINYQPYIDYSYYVGASTEPGNLNQSHNFLYNNRSSCMDYMNNSLSESQKLEYPSFEYQYNTNTDSNDLSSPINTSNRDINSNELKEDYPLSKQDYYRNKRNNTSPRFKKCLDGKNRNNSDNSRYNYQYQQNCIKQNFELKNNGHGKKALSTSGRSEAEKLNSKPEVKSNLISYQHKQQFSMLNKPMAPLPTSMDDPYANSAVSYGHMSYVPINPCSLEPDQFPGYYFLDASNGSVPVPYLSSQISINNSSHGPFVPNAPIYPVGDGAFPIQFPSIYPSYVVHPTMYQNQSSVTNSGNVYPSVRVYPGQTYFLPYSLTEPQVSDKNLNFLPKSINTQNSPPQ